MKRRKTSTKRVIVIVLMTFAVGVGTFLWIADNIFSNAVPRAAVMGFSPLKIPLEAVIDPQTEPHTCGLHSLRSIYRAYGLKPDEHELRMRLGVDIAANPVDETSTGTLQPDLTRVLAQDGFSVELLELDGSHVALRLKAHLTHPQKALALIRKLDNGNLHWVVLQQGPIHQSDMIEVIDPLSKVPRHEGGEAFLKRQAVTVFLLGVQERVDKKSIQSAHRLGVAEMSLTPTRVKQLERGLE